MAGLKVRSYQPPPVNETTFILPAPGNPGGTKASAPRDDVTPRALRSVSLSGVRLPGLLCSTWLLGNRVPNRICPGPKKARAPSLFCPICDPVVGYNEAVPE